jgi:hypothetical protein
MVRLVAARENAGPGRRRGGILSTGAYYQLYDKRAAHSHHAACLRPPPSRLKLAMGAGRGALGRWAQCTVNIRV